MSDALADLRFGDVLTFLTVHRCGAITGDSAAVNSPLTPSLASTSMFRAASGSTVGRSAGS